MVQAPRLALLGTIVALFSCVALAQQSESAPVAFSIEQQPMLKALNAWAQQAKLQLIWPAGSEAAQQLSPRVVGRFPPREALEMLLEGSALEATMVDAQTVEIRPVAQADAKRVTSERGEAVPSLQVAQASSVKQKAVVPSSEATPQDLKISSETKNIDEVVVTGTHIRGVKDQFSPVKTIGRDDMDLAGYQTTADVFKDLTQNFGGGVTSDTIGAGDVQGAGGASINLRGLGNEATLILLNGRRLAPGGLQGNYVDISTIPTSAIDRIEVASDGASAIYGSDAIAGVVNIILRKDFDGFETRVGASDTDQGGGSTLRLGQTAGFSNASAHGLLSYEYARESELDANDRGFSANSTDPTYLTPFNRKHSLFASGGVSTSDSFSLSTDAYYNKRDTEMATSSFTTALQQTFRSAEVEQVGASIGANTRLFTDWETNASGSYSSNHFLGNSQALTTGVRGLIDSKTDTLSADLSAGGSIFSITTDPTKAVLGVQYRKEHGDLLQRNLTTGVSQLDQDRKRDVFAAYAEIYAPIVSEGNEVPGVNRLAVTAAARYEDYSDVGSSFDPKFGLVLSPFDGINIRGTWSTAFRAPRLDQLTDSIFSTTIIGFVDPQAPGGQSVALLVGGDRADLRPEQAESWTVGFDLEPHFAKGLTVRATYFNVSYADRIGLPTLSINSQLQVFGFTAIPVRNPSLQDLQSFVSRATFSSNLTASTINGVSVLLDSRTQNLRSSKVDGIDLGVDYDLATSAGQLNLSLDSTILGNFTDQAAPLAAVNDRLDTFGNPVNLRIRGGLALVCDAYTLALFGNYIDGYIDNGAVGGSFPIKAWTTLDTSARVDLGRIVGGSFTEDLGLTFSIANIFDKDPPRIGNAPLRAARYDAANSDPYGRRFSLLITKNWGHR